jgi:hypothetical protein
MKKIMSLLVVLAMVATTSLGAFAQEISLSESDIATIEQARVDFLAGICRPNGSEIYNLAMDVMKNHEERIRHDHNDKDDPSTMEWILLGILVALSISAVADHAQRQEACIKRCTEQTGQVYDECLAICRSNPDAF